MPLALALDIKPQFAHITGSLIAGLFLSRIHAWCRWKRGQSPDDPEDWWVWMTGRQWREQTGMNRYELDQARKTCAQLGLVETKNEGPNNRTWFRLCYEKLGELLEQYEEALKQEAAREKARRAGLGHAGRPRKDREQEQEREQEREREREQAARPAREPVALAPGSRSLETAPGNHFVEGQQSDFRPENGNHYVGIRRSTTPESGAVLLHACMHA